MCGLFNGIIQFTDRLVVVLARFATVFVFLLTSPLSLSLALSFLLSSKVQTNTKRVRVDVLVCKFNTMGVNNETVIIYGKP